MDNKEELAHLVALSTFAKFGARSLLKLKRAFSCWSAVWTADLDSLKQAGIDDNVAQEFISARSSIKPEAEWAKLSKEDIQVMALGDKDYPLLLKEIYDPPVLLYYRGRLKADSDPHPLAVVGSRHPSPYGRQVTPEIVGELARQGLTIVSGLALGIDALSHEATLNVAGRTIAVLGSGLNADNIYPVSNRQLSQRIIAGGGAVISEFPLGTLPLRHHFPIRNRIISGLCIGTLVVEASEESGSLITARSALEQNREVFSIPGSIYSSLSYGPNNLLKMGAKVVTCAADILETFRLESAVVPTSTNSEIKADSAEEAALLASLTREPLHIDQLVKITSLSAPAISSCLTLMEMKGRVRNLGGMRYVLIN